MDHLQCAAAKARVEFESVAVAEVPTELPAFRNHFDLVDLVARSAVGLVRKIQGAQNVSVGAGLIQGRCYRRRAGHTASVDSVIIPDIARPGTYVHIKAVNEMAVLGELARVAR